MRAGFRRMAARLWPDTLFGRLAIILFSGLVAAHALAFVLIALDRLTIEDESGNKFAAVDIADAVAILNYVAPEERPAWLDRISRLNWRYALGDEGEIAHPSSRRLQANIARLRVALGPDHDATFVQEFAEGVSHRLLLKRREVAGLSECECVEPTLACDQYVKKMSGVSTAERCSRDMSGEKSD